MDDLNELISRYKNSGLLIDTNIFLLYVVGMYDPDRISRFKRTMTFTLDDFGFLSGFLKQFTKLVTTPNILTEVSNLSGQLPEALKTEGFNQFSKLISSFEENFGASAKVSSLTHFCRLGLTDSGIIDLVRDKYLVLTDDFKLADYLEKEGIDVINFNHLRSLIWNA